jgi:hypothetical protein
MAKQEYKDVNFKTETYKLIVRINKIIEDYMEQGYTVTVRQLYYRLVAKAEIENTEKSYKRITGIVNDARIAGLIDWDAIEDRTRSFIRRSRWENGKQVLEGCASQFHMDMWKGQEDRVFCLVEKEALVGVLERVCNTFDIPLLAARGYPSGTVLREFAQSDIIPHAEDGQNIIILHLGDHDPSGLDMTRDLEERIKMFSEHWDGDVTLKRIALNMDQIAEQKPPPNPAKQTDARFKAYADQFGDESWELDALSPSYLNDLVRDHVERHIDHELWHQRQNQINAIKYRLKKVAAEFA